MRRVLPMAAMLVAIVALACGVCTQAFAAASADRPRVILVLATGLAWSDITATNTPTLARLAAEGAVGNLNAVPRAREAYEPVSALEGALDLSTGNWATPQFPALGAYDATEAVQSTRASVVYRRSAGTEMGAAEIAFLGLPPTARVNAASADSAVLGTLGTAIEAAGGTTSAIGNSDAPDATGEFKIERPAAIAAMNALGLVSFGDVSRALLTSSPSAPYGLRTDLGAFERAFAAAESSAAVHGGPALFVLDPGDEYRARRYAWQAGDAVKAAQHADAVREADDVAAMAMRHANRSDVVIVATQGPAETVPGVIGFSPLLVSGAGLTGYLTSSSTHRTGIAANPDVTAFILAQLGADRPVSVIGNTLIATPAPPQLAERIGYLSARNLTAASLDAIRGPFADIYLRFFALLLVLAGLFVGVRRQLPTRVLPTLVVALKAAGLLAMSVLTAAWAMFLPMRDVSSPAEAWLALSATTAVLVVSCALVWRLLGDRAALAGVLLLTSLLLLVDQLLGAPLSFTNLIGYSPLQAARYYGIGNEAAALMVGTALVGTGLVLDGWGDAPWASAARRFGIPVLGLLLVMAAAAPFFGANVGVAIWATIGFVVLWVRANGKRFGVKHAVAALVLIALLVAGFAAVDVLKNPEKTHLARSLSSAEQGGPSQLVQIVARKAQTNASVLATSTWTVMLVATLAFLAFTRLRKARDLSIVLAENPAFAAALAAGLSAGVVAFFTEDTGILVPTFVLLSSGVGAMWLVLSATEAEEICE